MSVNRYLLPIVVISTLLGTVLGSQVLGWWSTSGRTSVDLDQLSPDEIKGWMTLQQVADGLSLSLGEVYQIGGIPAAVPPETALKDLEEIIEVSALRDGLASYISGRESAEPTAEPTFNPEATAVPTAKTPVPTSAASVESREQAQHTGDGIGPTPLPPGEILPANQIKGRMTLRDVSEQCAVELDTLSAALNLPPDTDPDTQLKTLIGEGVLDEVTEVQEAVALLQQEK